MRVLRRLTFGKTLGLGRAGYDLRMLHPPLTRPTL